MELMQRLSPYSQKYKVVEVAGLMVTVPVVDDLDDTALLEQIRYFLEGEDFEYVEHLCTEAQRRNLQVKHLFKTENPVKK